MEAWRPLKRSVTDKVWDQFYAHFDFRPGVESPDWPGIREPTPSITYSIARPFEGCGSRERFIATGMQLNLATLAAFRRCVQPSESLYVLDWQHPCYEFYPHLEFNVRDRSQWKIQPFPDGDYYAFLDPEFAFGTFGHPWERTFCIFGQSLIDAFDPSSVLWLGPVVRRNGEAA